MTNGQLFIKENPTVEVKINGSCVWIYFDGVNHYTMPVEWWDKEIDVLDKIREEIKEKIEQEEFARSVFRGEEKDAVKAEQCTGSIMAYNNVIKFIDKYRNEVSK